MRFYSNTFSAPTWNRYSLHTACFSVEVSPLDGATYQSRVEVAELEELSLALVESQASVVLRKNEDDSTENRKRYSLLYVVRGDLAISYQQRLTALRQGEFVLIDNAHPRSMFVYDSVSLLLICMPRNRLLRQLPAPEELVGRVLRDTLEANRSPLFKPILALWEPLREGALNAFAPSIEDALLRNIGTVYASQRHAGPRSHHAARLSQRVKAFIESQLDNPQLRVESIAAHFRVSSRYLRSVFQSEEKLSQYILRRRLEESARQLTDPLQRGTSITEIAHRCGFSSSTHFARCFKALYGERARDFRRRRQVC